MNQSERIVLDSTQEAEAKSELLTRWLCRSDARQVSDLPEKPSTILRVFDRESRVGDPLRKREIADGKSKTCRASEWRSQIESNAITSDV